MEPAGSLSKRCTGAVVPFPPIDERLVASLATQFPDLAPDMSMTDREIMFRAGQVSVVRWLAAKLYEQQEVE